MEILFFNYRKLQLISNLRILIALVLHRKKSLMKKYRKWNFCSTLIAKNLAAEHQSKQQSSKQYF